MKKLLYVLVGFVVVGSVYAATDYDLRDRIDKLFRRTTAGLGLNLPGDLDVSGDAAVDGTVTVGGAASFVNVTVSGTLSGSVVSSNAVGSLFTSNLTVVAGGAISVPAASVSAAALSGNVVQARITNALATASAMKVTNTCMAANGKTNTYIFSPVGSVYVLSSISTTP
jgi:hypothetical protein